VLGLALSTAAAGSFDHLVDTFRERDENRAQLALAYVLQALSALSIALVLRFLYRAAAARDPDSAPRLAGPLAIAAPIAVAVTAVATIFPLFSVIDAVLDALPLSEEGVEDIVRDEQSSGLPLAIYIAGTLAAFALASAFILISRFARRVGLLSQFMGTIGVIVGVILVLGPLLGQVLGALPIVQWFFLGALGALFLGRWPGGRGPAWESGEAVPWPSAAELRTRAAEEAGEEPRGRRGRVAAPEPEDEYEEEPDDDAEPGRPAHPRSKKRKRKRRR
jgi:hypothetical protein